MNKIKKIVIASILGIVISLSSVCAITVYAHVHNYEYHEACIYSSPAGTQSGGVKSHDHRYDI